MDPLFHFNADPDRTLLFNADPDPATHKSDANLWPHVYGPIVSIHALHFDPLNAGLDPDLDPDFHPNMDSNSDPVSLKNVNPCGSTGQIRVRNTAP